MADAVMINPFGAKWEKIKTITITDPLAKEEYVEFSVDENNQDFELKDFMVVISNTSGGNTGNRCSVEAYNGNTKIWASGIGGAGGGFPSGNCISHFISIQIADKAINFSQSQDNNSAYNLFGTRIHDQPNTITKIRLIAADGESGNRLVTLYGTRV